jgi:hypothetical protein
VVTLSGVDTLLHLSAQEDDDRAFLLVAARLFAALQAPFDLLVVVRVRGWFDHKWLGFSGKGLVPFQHFRPTHPGVAIEAFHQEKLTFPPFSPNRIVAEDHFATIDTPNARNIHSHRRQRSAPNLHRRVVHYARSLLAVWISTASAASGRASFMAYSCTSESTPESWYASFRRHEAEWRLDRVKGVHRQKVAAWVADSAE